MQRDMVASDQPNFRDSRELELADFIEDSKYSLFMRGRALGHLG